MVTSQELTRDQTLWAFVSDSDEPRHLQDIVYAVHALRTRGVPEEKIKVFTDHPVPGPFLSPFQISHFPLSNLLGELKSASDLKAVVITVTGHGGIRGIGAGRTVFSPHSLLEAIRGVPALEIGVVLLGQCFAGVFDMVDAATKPPLVLMGATRLNNSLSTITDLTQPILQQDGSVGLASWGANVFLFHFFRWVANPIDLDGDGHLSLADAFKYAGVCSNQHMIDIKSGKYLEVRRLASAMEQLSIVGPGISVTPMQMQAIRDRLQISLETLHLHQEPWLLNANLAREARFLI